MKKHCLPVCIVVLSVLAVVICGRIISPAKYVPSSDVFPSCVEVVEVWPPPNSALKPFNESHNSFVYYAFRITFSKPVDIEYLDTSGGYQEEMLSRRFNDPNGRLFSADDISPIFLSPSPTNLTRYYPYRLKNWRGSGRVFMIYFVLSIRISGLELTDKVYLIVDGGRFYSSETVGSGQQRVYAQTAIIGEYYFQKYLQSHPQYKTKAPKLLVPSVYCTQQAKRPYFTISDTQGTVDSGDDSLGGLAVELPSHGHSIHSVSSTFMSDPETFTEHRSTLLLLSVSTRGWGGKVTIRLPPTVTASFKDVNVTVKLRPHNITITQPMSVPRLTVPVVRSLVYDLRERIYHNKHKVMTRSDVPVFARSPLSSEPSDRKLFPQTLVTSRSKLVNMDVVDPVLGVKLRHYYSRSQYTGSTALPLRDIHWNEVTRTAPTAARTDRVRYPTVQGAFDKVNDMSKKKFLRDNHRACPPDSIRNPGRYGTLIDHVVEFGHMYHMLEPMDFSTWSIDEAAMEAMLITKDGERKPLSIKSRHDLYSNSFPPLVRKALENYVCLLPPTKDVSRPTRGQDEKWVFLDECIFVPTEVARSRECGGLMLFKNIASIVSDTNFCNKRFGDCIGLPIHSTKRFPVIPTYGLHELTGWVATSQELLDFQAHPVGSHLVKKPKFAMPRSLLKYTKAHDALENALDRITLQFLPVMGPSSRMDYSVEMTEEFEILSARIAAPGDDFCDSVWQLEIEDVSESLDPNAHKSALLTATVINDGEGGGEYVFNVRCSNQIIVDPTVGAISTWLSSGVQDSVSFKLDAKMASGISNKVHKCLLSVAIKTYPELHIDASPPALCDKYIETFYGSFVDTCDYHADLPLIDLVYYFVPLSHVESVDGLNSSIGFSNLHIARVITISLKIPRGEEKLAQALREMSVQCGSDQVFPVEEDQLSYAELSSFEAHNRIVARKPLVYTSQFTKERKVIFLANSESQGPSDCSIELKVSRPNWLCPEKLQVLKKLYVPLTDADVKAIQQYKAGPFAYLVSLYGPQSHGMMLSLFLCLITTIILSATTAVTHVVLHIYRNKLPKKGTLTALKEDIEKAEKEDAEYWENPQVYLNAPNVEGIDAHFVLYDFKFTESLNTSQLKNVKVAGTLKYTHKELQVMFGHIKKVYVDSSGESGDIWLHASSGMYFLPFQNVAPDYESELVDFLKTKGIKFDKIDID